MPLPNLIPAGGQIAVQNTTFTVDALGRYVCSTWDEATGERRRAVLRGRRRRRNVWRVLRDEDISTAPGQARAAARRGTLPRVGARAEPRSDRTQRAVGDCAVERSGRGARSRMGHCRGAATSSFPGSPTAPAASRSTGADGVHGSPPPTCPGLARGGRAVSRRALHSMSRARPASCRGRTSSSAICSTYVEPSIVAAAGSVVRTSRPSIGDNGVQSRAVGRPG